MIEAFDTLRSGLAVAVACQALGVPRATAASAQGHCHARAADSSDAATAGLE